VLPGTHKAGVHSGDFAEVFQDHCFDGYSSFDGIGLLA